MGREVRMVPADWEHPKDARGRFIPLFDFSFTETHKEWVDGFTAWQQNPKSDCTYSEWEGAEPSKDEYMPDWHDSERTHFQMYESTSEGTPISPVMKSAKTLAQWLADTNASSFGSQTATYDQWLNMIGHGSAVSMISSEGNITSGVESLPPADTAPTPAEEAE